MPTGIRRSLDSVAGWLGRGFSAPLPANDQLVSFGSEFIVMYRIGAVFGFRAIVALGLGLLVCMPTNARGDVLAQLYGSGVHAYFARDYREAYETLTATIEAGAKDPRCYYFRGLALIRLGRDDAAEGDFVRGAELESAGGDRVYDINKALRRVQGRTRLLLERHRAHAQVTKSRRLAEYRANRYSRIRGAESVVTSPVPFDTSGEDRGTLQAPLSISESVEAPADADIAGPTTDPPTPLDLSSPAGNDPPPPLEVTADTTADSEPATGDVERAEEPAPPEEMPAESLPKPADDPFPAGEPPEQPKAPEEMPDEPAGDTEKPTDPFADDPAEESADKNDKPPANETPADDDPFADDDDEVMPAEEKPKEEPADDDPFADDDDSKDDKAKKPAKESDEDDPFADDDDEVMPADAKPKKEPADDDPFADDDSADEKDEEPAEDDPFADDEDE